MSSRKQVFRCVLSGSFHKDKQSLISAYNELTSLGCQVISPHHIDFVNNHAEVVRHETEKEQSAREIENHHLLAIRQSDFVWLHAPDGYVGLSGAMEIGYALAAGKPIFASTEPEDEMIKQFVTIVPSAYKAMESQLSSG